MNGGGFEGARAQRPLSGGTLVGAAVKEASKATGINGDQSNNSATDSGAVYTF